MSCEYHADERYLGLSTESRVHSALRRADALLIVEGGRLYYKHPFDGGQDAVRINRIM